MIEGIQSGQRAPQNYAAGRGAGYLAGPNLRAGQRSAAFTRPWVQA